jgi:hypothetical protein
MTRVAFNAEHFGDHLESVAAFTKNLESNRAAHIGQLSRQVNQRSFGTDILGCALGNNVSAGGFVPLSFNFEGCEISWA